MVGPFARISARHFVTSTSRAHGVRSMGVIGAGQLGLGIAYVAAKTAKVNVLVADNSPAVVSKGLAFLDTLFAKDVKKGKLTEQESVEARARIVAVDGPEAFSSVDLVVEAVSESLPLKRKIFANLATFCPPAAILASNTSSISLTSIAAAAVPANETNLEIVRASAARVVGLHFFNPVPVMKLVEIIAALQTSPEVVERASQFARAMGKELTVSKDTPGFISNRLLMPFINEAIIVLESGIATKEDIDQTLKLGMNHPMGPLALADFIGLDTCLAIQQTLMEETGDSKYRPSVLLGRMVAAGWLGKKSGRGFYEY